MHRFHVVNFILLPVMYLVGCLLSGGVSQWVLFFLIALVNLWIVAGKIKYKSLAVFSLALMPVIVATFLSRYFFLQTQVIQQVSPMVWPRLMGRVITFSPRIIMASRLSIRLYALSIISFAYAYHMPQQEIITYLTQRKILSVRIGYALLAVSNAFQYLGAEFSRMRMAYQMRYNKRYLSLRIIFPLLISAARYAHQLSISLYSRGLHQDKTYVVMVSPVTWYDALYMIINLSITIFVLCKIV